MFDGSTITVVFDGSSITLTVVFHDGITTSTVVFDGSDSILSMAVTTPQRQSLPVKVML